MIQEYKQQLTCIRELARRLAETAATEANAHRRKMWADHNDMCTSVEPLIWVCPDDDGGWLELVPERSLQCEDADLRLLERKLKQYLYQAEFLHDDFVFEPTVYMQIPGEYTGYLYGHAAQKTAWGIPMQKKEAGVTAYHLDCWLNSEEDYQKLLNHEVDFIPDQAEWKRLDEKYQQAVGGIIDIQFQLPYSVLVQSLLIELVHLRGLEELMYDLYDAPERLQQVLHHMAVSKANLLQKLERENRLFDNRINIYTGSGGLGYTNAMLKDPKSVTLADMWGFADAQEFSGVSAEMFETFAIQNQKIGLNLFAVENIGTRAIFSWKPNPAKICMGFDEETVFHWLCEVASRTKNCVTEIILKDIRTCGGTNQNLVKFIELARRAFGKTV